jgi:hypothetical protein
MRLSYLPLLRWLFGYPRTDVLVADEAPDVAPPAASERPAPGPAPLLFSGGVDSLYSLVRLRQVGYPLRMLVNLNAGAHGFDRATMRLRFERMQRLAERADLDAHLIDTNFHEVVRVPHRWAHEFRNISAAYALYGATDGLAYSTTYAFRDTGLGRAKEALDHGANAIKETVAWSRMPLIEVGYEAIRFDKMRALADEPLTWDTLDVCVDAAYQLAAGPGEPINCSRCFKCVRAMLTLEHIGALERYHTQFDIGRMATERDAMVEMMAGRTYLLDTELIDHLGGAVEPDVPAIIVTPPRGL